MPDITEFLSRGIAFGWCFAFVWHFLMACLCHWMSYLEDMA